MRRASASDRREGGHARWPLDGACVVVRRITTSARLRDQVDLDGLRRELAKVVSETMHPVHAAVWSREARR